MGQKEFPTGSKVEELIPDDLRFESDLKTINGKSISELIEKLREHTSYVCGRDMSLEHRILFDQTLESRFKIGTSLLNL